MRSTSGEGSAVGEYRETRPYLGRITDAWLSAVSFNEDSAA